MSFPTLKTFCIYFGYSGLSLLPRLFLGVVQVPHCVVASLVDEHGLWGVQGASVAAVRGLSSFDSKGSRTWAQWLRAESWLLCGMWELKSLSPAWASRFSTFEPLGKV